MKYIVQILNSHFYFYFLDRCKVNETMTKVGIIDFIFSRFDAKQLNRRFKSRVNKGIISHLAS